MILASRVVLVEGPTEELILQRLYRDIHNKDPLTDRVDIITVRGLAFERFLEISCKLKIQTAVITDNDGNIAKVSEKYAKYSAVDFVHVFYPSDSSLSTLEKAVVDCNTVEKLESVLGKSFSNRDEALNYMLGNKTEWAIKVLESPDKIEYPEYLKNAIN
jgi:predicted ATP-dependent endonuclease of OLD family